MGIIGTRSMLKSLFIAMLEPTKLLKQCEDSSNYTKRFALTEELKSMPFPAVWHYYCAKNNVTVSYDWMKEVETYENKILAKRK